MLLFSLDVPLGSVCNATSQGASGHCATGLRQMSICYSKTKCFEKTHEVIFVARYFFRHPVELLLAESGSPTLAVVCLNMEKTSLISMTHEYRRLAVSLGSFKRHHAVVHASYSLSDEKHSTR